MIAIDHSSSRLTNDNRSLMETLPTMSHLRFLPLLAALAIVAGGRADAAYVITFAQVGNNVVATGVGSLDFTGLQSIGDGPYISALSSSNPRLVVGPSSLDTKSGHLAFFSNTTGFGTGGVFRADAGSGPVAGFNAAAASLITPLGYASGDLLSTSAVYSNQTFASLGLTAGIYTYAYSATSGGATVDSFTVVIPSSVPEPASLVLCGLAGVIGLGVARFRCNRISA